MDVKNKRVIAQMIGKRISACKRLEELCALPEEEKKFFSDELMSLISSFDSNVTKLQLQEILNSEEKLNALTVLSETAVEGLKKKNFQILDAKELMKDIAFEIIKAVFVPRISKNFSCM